MNANSPSVSQFDGGFGMKGRVFVYSVTALAILLGAVYLSTRGGVTGTSLAAYSAPVSLDLSHGFLFVESFDLARHRTMPLEVEEVSLVTSKGIEPTGFEQEGVAPALVRYSRPHDSDCSVRIRASNDIGEVETVIPFPAVGLGGGHGPWDSRLSQGWPVEIACGDFEFVLLSESGVPEVGREGRVLVLSVGDPPDRTEAVIETRGQSSSAPFEEWGGAVLSFEPRSLRVRASLSLRVGTGSREFLCSADFMVGAAGRRTCVQETGTTPAGAGRFGTSAVISTRTGAETMYGMAFVWDEGGAGPMVDAHAATVRDGNTRISLDLPRPGLYLVRYTSEPLVDGNHGVNHLVAAGAGLDTASPLSLLWDDLSLSEEALRQAMPYFLSVLAVRTPVRLSQLVNTSTEQRRRVKAGNTTRDIVLLGLLGVCLAALIIWMSVVVVRGYLASRRRLVEDGEDWSTEAASITPGRSLWYLVLLVLILGAAATALIFVLQTM